MNDNTTGAVRALHDEVAEVIRAAKRMGYMVNTGVTLDLLRRVQAALAQQPESLTKWNVVQIGNRGAFYDPPNTRRAFTYAKQPGNVDASWLGRAAAMARPGGDSIDHGLSLLKELQAMGFGVFQIDKEKGDDQHN